uniref:Sodium/potassium-transporting ATPase subunit alpha-1 n=1 Tax=Sus scrofa TaxID=9823 RepID=A0A480H9S2_PIG
MLRCFPTRVEFRIPRLKYTKGGWGRGRSMWRDAPRRAGGGLVVGFLLHPAARASPDDELPDFVIDEDEERVGEGTEPPGRFEGVHPQGHAHSGAVGEESSQGRLFEEAKDQDFVLHPLLEDGIPPGLADDQVGPLHHHDADKEGRVAGELHDLPLFVGPLLPVAVLHVVDPAVIPVHPEAQQVNREEAVLSQDHKVSEEAAQGLDHTYLSVGHADESLIDEFVCLGVSGLPLHDVALRLLIRQGDGRNHVCAQVDAEDGDGAQGQWNVRNNKYQEGGDLWNVTGEGVGNGFLQVIKDQTTFLYSRHNGGEVVIQEDHVSSLLGHVRASNPHGNPDVCLLQSGRVIDTVASHGHDGALSLAAFHNDELLLRRRPGKHDLRVVLQDVIQLLRGHVFQIASMDHAGLGIPGVHLAHWDVEAGSDVFDRFIAFRDDAHTFGNGFGCDGMIAGDHDDLRQEIGQFTACSCQANDLKKS